MLKRVVIENYRSCLKTSIDFHPNLSVLIGPNSSGKTNILQAIMFLSKMTRETGPRRLREQPITVSSRLKADFALARGNMHLNARVIAYTDESNNDVMLASQQRWTLKGPKRKEGPIEVPLTIASRNALGFGTKYFRRVSLTGDLSFGEIPHISKHFYQSLKAVEKYCSGIRYYGASQFTNPGTCPASFQIEAEGERRSPLPLRGHARILYNMYSAWKARPNSRYLQFIDIVGAKGLRLIDDLTFNEVKTSSIDYRVRVGGKVETRTRNKLLVIPQFKIGTQQLSPNQLSDGTFKTLALLFYILTEDSTALLIEEPEVCVHHGLLSSILELIKSASVNKQMILSTHSDYVLDHVSPDNVYRVALDKSLGTIARPIRKTMTAKEFAALRDYLQREGNLGEYWREGGLGDHQ